MLFRSRVKRHAIDNCVCFAVQDVRRKEKKEEGKKRVVVGIVEVVRVGEEGATERIIRAGPILRLKKVYIPSRTIDLTEMINYSRHGNISIETEHQESQHCVQQQHPYQICLYTISDLAVPEATW